MPDTARPSPLGVGSWVLYDLANTLFSLNIVSLYYSLWVVNVMGGRDAEYALANGLSMAVIFFASPFLGALTDQARRRMPFLVASTLVCVGCTTLLGSYGLAASLVLFAIANVSYQAGLQFYDAMLPSVSTERNRGTVGGIGVGVGYLGSVLGIVIGWVLLGTTTGLPAADVQARYVRLFQATAVAFLVFALPCFLFVRERLGPSRGFGWSTVRDSFRQVVETFHSSRRYPGLFRFLVGRVFYTDAINTVIIFMGIYVTNEVGYTDDEVRTVMLTAILFSVLGGFAFGPLADRFGPRRTLHWVLYLWAIDFVWAAAVGLFRLPKPTFWPAAVLAGIALGGTWAADRPYMLRLTPPSRVGEFYGLYGMVGRFSAITGPFIWALVSDYLGLGRPAAILTLLGGIVIAYLILRPVSDTPRHWDQNDA
jgi:UMF1 family MFS transporter